MNMNNMFIVFYYKAPNFSITHYQSENRYIGNKIFHDLDEAKRFASTVDVESIINGTGKRII